MVNDYHITSAANWDGPHGTGHFQDRAGTGRTERQSRAMAIHIGQSMQPLPRVASPLSGLNDTAAFVDEISRDYQRNVAKDALIGGVLGFAITRAIQTRRGHR